MARVALAWALSATGCAVSARTALDEPTRELHVFAEGPCPRLSVFAAGARRLLVYGDTGYDLHGWYEGEPLAAAEAVVELRQDGAYRDPALLAGLGLDARGYVPADLAFGGSFDDASAWLLATRSRYARHGGGALFERHALGYARGEAGWARTADAVALPPEARDLPELPKAGPCGDELVFVPTAWDATTAGDVMVAGRCDDARAQNPRPALFVAHGDAGSGRWRFEPVPAGEGLDGILNLDIEAVSAREAYLVAYEPFARRDERHAFLVRWDGERWAEYDLGIRDGMMAVAHSADGSLWIAAGRALYRRTGDGARRAEPVPLPALRYVDVPTSELHIHDVVAFAPGDVWVSASHRLTRSVPGVDHPVTVWASALYHSSPPGHPLYCDASLPADEALTEIE